MHNSKDAANEITALFLINFILNSCLVQKAQSTDLQINSFIWQAIETADTINTKEGLNQKIGVLKFQ